VLKKLGEKTANYVEDTSRRDADLERRLCKEASIEDGKLQYEDEA
jgi:hypothetical protein